MPSLIFALPEFDYLKKKQSISLLWEFEVYAKTGPTKEFMKESLTLLQFFNKKIEKLQLQEWDIILATNNQEREEFNKSVTFEKIHNSYIAKSVELSQILWEIATIRYKKDSKSLKEKVSLQSRAQQIQLDKQKIIVFLKESVEKNPDIAKQTREYFQTIFSKWPSLYDTDLYTSLDIWVLYWDFEYIKDESSWIVYKNSWKWKFFWKDGKQVTTISGRVITNIIESEKFVGFRDILKKASTIGGEIQSRVFINELSKYFEQFPEVEKGGVFFTFKKAVKEEKLFPQMRSIFTSEKPPKSWNFTIDFWWNTFFEKNINTFSLFWDYEFLEKEDTIFENDKNWSFENLVGGPWLVIRNRDVVKIKERKDIDFNKIWYSPLAKSLGEWVMDGKKNKDLHWKDRLGWDCGGWVWRILTVFWFKGLEKWDVWDRLWKKWWEFLEPLVPTYFIKVKIDNHTQAKPGGLLWYNASKYWSAARQNAWHVEIVWADGRYYYDWVANTPCWSALTSYSWSREELLKSPANYKKVTGFSGYVYYPVKLNT